MKVVTPEGYTFVTKFQEDNSHKVLRSVDFFSIKFDEIFFDTVCWGPPSTILFRARTNTLQLNDRNRHRNKEIHCEACGNLEEKEDLYHFMLHCPAYIKERSTIQQLQQPYIEDEKQILGTFLFEKTHIDKKKEDLYQLWRARQRRLKTTRA